ncbi:MAG: hypothetical protein OXD49_10830 [Candidatus Poribacteria bacterium]|nr:hypothetical protein [Candidatus Poribacteria bacterium]
MPFSICLCFFIFLTNCGTDKDPGIPKFQPDTSDTTPGDISDKLVARIYFDATLSMQGFVVPDSTRYTQMCPYLESVIVSGWENEKVDFFRFGEQVEPIDRNIYLQAEHIDFYEQENIYRETFIQKVIDYEDQLANNKTEGITISEESTEMEVPNTPEESTETLQLTEIVDAQKKEGGLVVIVTDLFQDRGDINLLVAQLKEKYIKKGIAVGLFGMRSQFDGTVYDTGIGQPALPYRSDPGNPETFRPFYLLVLGKHADIAHYFDLLKANNPDAKTIIFSRYLVSPLLSFEGATIDTLVNLNRKTHVRSEDPRLKQYEIVRNSDPARILAKLKYVPLSHAMFFDSKTFEVSTIAKPIGETAENLDAAECMEVISKLNEDGNEISVVFSLDPEDLQHATYLYEVTVSPDVDAYHAPKWCSDWNMGTERDGSKTLNLVNFVRDLSQVTARRHRPKIAKFHCYIGER